MQNPAYLTLSRHRIYLFRFPLPRAFHPQGKASEIRISLQTRCSATALHLSQSLAYFGRRAIQHQAIRYMDYQQIRSALTDHFKALLARRMEEMNTHGRLGAESRMLLQATADLNTSALESQDFSITDMTGDVDRYIEAYSLPIVEGSKPYETLRKELLTAHRDYCRAVLEHDTSLGQYSFNEASISAKPTSNGKRLQATLEVYIAEKLRTDEWTDNTSKEYQTQFALLKEFLGLDAPLDIDSETASTIKQMLLAIPKNRKKLYPKLSLSEVCKLPLSEANRMSVINVNKYLSTYAAFYAWAMKNRHINDNPFSGLTVGKNKKATKEAFTPDAVAKMYEALTINQDGLIKKEYQKWGPLIAMFTGARANEIAQLELADIKKEKGIWYFDFTDESEDEESKKALKNTASKRTVPIHSRLIDLGLLKHVESVHALGKERLLYELTYSKKNGYAKNLSRWFNGPFLSALGLKKKTLSLHCLRHTMAGRLLSNGVDLPLTQSIIGHTKKGTVFESYAPDAYTLENKKDALEKAYASSFPS